ncbi:hypothetical protein AVEN_92320-1 [Araneus ventricosus]|uniref:Uncharacterized protein n=1 Tax=Araneus ventricosus TaxID=182803 RepID=A0A4Y2AN58_ARAVE|nr:hypothetical protein AVEN_92320-1 [Araneus ventricosus]
MTRTTPELGPSSPNFRTAPAGGRLTHDIFSVHQAHKQNGSLVELGFEPRALQLRGRDLTSRPPRLFPARSYIGCGGGLVTESQFRNLQAVGSRPDPTDPPHTGPAQAETFGIERRSAVRAMLSSDIPGVSVLSIDMEWFFPCEVQMWSCFL